MSNHIKNSEVWAEMARRKVQFHKNDNWADIKLWGLFPWGPMQRFFKSGKLINDGYVRENKIIWVRPSREAYLKHIKPLIDKYTLSELTDLAGWRL